jgi:hypothetical protein
MKHFNRYHLGILPLLSILAMSPSVMLQSQPVTRQIASLEAVKAQTKYETLVSKINKEILSPSDDLTPKSLILKRTDLRNQLNAEKEKFQKDQSDKDVVKAQRKSVEDLVISIAIMEVELKVLQNKSALDKTEEILTKKMIKESKATLEELLTDLENNESLVAKASEEVKEEEVKEEVAEEIKEEATEEAPKVADSEESKEEAKEEVIAESTPSKPEVCEAEAQNKILTAQVEDLMKQQNQILQALIGMTQMMLSMHQQQQQQQHAPNPFYANGPGFNGPYPYEYHKPQTAGNWVYYPNGFQPSQPNIFSPAQQPAPQFQQAQQTPQAGQGWELRPTHYFADPQYMPQPIIPGNFGGSSPLTFNMQNGVPTVSQL